MVRDLSGNGPLHVRDETSQVTLADVGFHGNAPVDVLAADLSRALLDDDVRELRQRNHASLRIGDLKIPDLVHAVAAR